MKENDNFKIDYSENINGKLFYDVIYNPTKTNFLKKAEENGNFIVNGKMMFVYQAHQAFVLWHKTMPDIDDKTIKLIEKND